MSDPLVVTVRGARGSAPSAGAATLRHGGNTTCVEVALAASRRIVIDCGGGFRGLAADLPADPGPAGYRFHVLLTHYHWDHIEGLPFFRPLYDERSRFSFRGFPFAGKNVEGLLEEVLAPPWFPIGFEDTPSSKTFEDLEPGSFEIEDVEVTAARLHHPQGVFGFRLARAGRSIVFATDHERGEPHADDALAALAGGCDVLIHDAQYTPAEYDARHRGWGHSTWRHAVEAAKEAGARRLVLFHHDPDRSDDAIDAILAEARREFPETDAAREGMTLLL